MDDSSAASIETLLFWNRDAAVRRIYNGLLTTLQPDIACDIGSLDGTEAIAMRCLLPNAAVHAFEANPDNFKRYFLDRPEMVGIYCHEACVGAFDGPVDFHLVTSVTDLPRETFDWRSGASSLLQRVDDVPTRTTRVRGVQLDTIFASEVELSRTFALWIDVEGAAERVLLGGTAVLARTLLIRCEVEHQAYWVGQSLAAEIAKYLVNHGFLRIADNHVPQHAAQGDQLFLNARWLEIICSG